MALRSPLTDPEFQALVLDLQTRFGWSDPCQSYRVERAWESRTATLALLAGYPDGRRVVLKLLAEGEPDQAEAIDRAQRHLRAAFATRSPVTISEALGWSADPVATCTAWTEGHDLIRMLADLDHPAWQDSGADPVELVASCGRALGTYHAIEHPQVHEGSEDLAAAARAMLLDPVRLQAAGRPPVVPSFGDFGPHQFIIAPDGVLALIDPPGAPVLAPPHKDLARFLFGLDKALARNQGPTTTIREQLRDALLAGYAETGACDPRREPDRHLVAIFEGATLRGVARHRWRIGRRGEALRFARRWLSHMRRARRWLGRSA